MFYTYCISLGNRSFIETTTVQERILRIIMDQKHIPSTLKVQISSLPFRLVEGVVATYIIILESSEASSPRRNITPILYLFSASCRTWFESRSGQTDPRTTCYCPIDTQIIFFKIYSIYYMLVYIFELLYFLIFPLPYRYRVEAWGK